MAELSLKNSRRVPQPGPQDGGALTASWVSNAMAGQCGWRVRVPNDPPSLVLLPHGGLARPCSAPPRRSPSAREPEKNQLPILTCSPAVRDTPTTAGSMAAWVLLHVGANRFPHPASLRTTHV